EIARKIDRDAITHRHAGRLTNPVEPASDMKPHRFGVFAPVPKTDVETQFFDHGVVNVAPVSTPIQTLDQGIAIAKLGFAGERLLRLLTGLVPRREHLITSR